MWHTGPIQAIDWLVPWLQSDGELAAFRCRATATATDNRFGSAVESHLAAADSKITFPFVKNLSYVECEVNIELAAVLLGIRDQFMYAFRMYDVIQSWATARS